MMSWLATSTETNEMVCMSSPQFSFVNHNSLITIRDICPVHRGGISSASWVQSMDACSLPVIVHNCNRRGSICCSSKLSQVLYPCCSWLTRSTRKSLQPVHRFSSLNVSFNAMCDFLALPKPELLLGCCKHFHLNV